MKINFRDALLQKRKSALLFTMKTFIFFFCTAAFSFSSGELLSQKVKITVDSDKIMTVEEVFDLIDKQTEYSFIYTPNLLTNLPHVRLKKGSTLVNKLLQESLSSGNFYLTVNKNKTISIKERELFTPISVQKKISGKVTDANGQPLPGANILIKGTSNGTQTDFEGNFSLTVSNPDAVLVVFYIGFLTQEVPVGGETSLVIALQVDAAKLDEVVVVGYGTQKKINLTGAVNTINSDAIEDRPISQASQALQGLTTGVFVNTNSGEAGNDEARLNIRGIGSLNQSSSPLVLIDGIEGSINDVAVTDIESFSVLKDAAAASIYGTRGAKGVILITTKRGNNDGKTTVKYNSFVGFSSPTVLPDMVLDNRTYLEVYRQAADNSGRNHNVDDAAIERYANLPSTNWQDVLLRESAPIQGHDLSFSGGSQNTNYYLSLGYFDKEGWIKGGQGFKRYNTRLNLNSKIGERLDIGTSLSFVKKEVVLTPKDGFGTSASSKGSTLFSGAIVAHPITPVFTESGFYGSIESDLGVERNRPAGQGVLDNETGDLDEDIFLGNIFLEYKLTEDLKIKGTLGLNSKNVSITEIKKEFLAYDAVTEQPASGGNALRNEGSSIEQRTSRSTEFTNIIQLNYDKIFGKHELKGLLGFNRQIENRNSTRIEESEFGSTDLIFLGNGTIQETRGILNDDSSLVSFFGRVNYIFDGKYLLEANIRRDGSSRFGANNRWGNFPSFSAGWVVSNEDFWGENSFINQLKFRGSWGILGSEPGDRFAFLSEFQLGEDYIGSSGGALNKLGNPDLKWEETESTNIGVNLGLFNNKVTLEGDYFIRKTTDILVEIENPLTSGISGETTFNAASMENKGWEASIKYRDKIGEHFKFSIGGNITHVKNKILTINPNLTGGADFVERDRADNIWWRRGESINLIYGHKFAGVFQSQEDIDNSPDHSFIDDPEPGDIKYTDQNGDGVIDLDDRVVLGNRNPEWLYGMNFDASYKNFEFSALFQGIGDAYVNLARETGPFPFAGLRSYWLDAWTPENPNNEIPRVWVDRRGYNGNTIEKSGKYNSFWMQNRRYIRLKNVQIAYNLPEKALEKTFITNAKIYVNGENLWTATPLIDFDPERDALQNHATATLPQSKTITFGVNLTF